MPKLASRGINGLVSSKRQSTDSSLDFPAFVTIERGSMKLFLSEHKGDARPDTLIYLQVADVHPIAKEFGVRVEEAPWGYEIELRDPDINRLRIGMPKPASQSG